MEGGVTRESGPAACVNVDWYVGCRQHMIERVQVDQGYLGGGGHKGVGRQEHVWVAVSALCGGGM